MYTQLRINRPTKYTHEGKHFVTREDFDGGLIMRTRVLQGGFENNKDARLYATTMARPLGAIYIKYGNGRVSKRLNNV